MHDVVIIGGGPAGLIAGTYLGRFLRPSVVIDSASSRARWIPTSHNIPGFAQGVGGKELLAQLRVQATKYGAEIRSGEVRALTREGELFGVHVGDEIIPARFVLLATGVRDRLPALPGAADALLRSVLRVCPICDGFEAAGRRIAVIGEGEHGEREAEFLLTYSTEVTYLEIGGNASHPRRDRLERAGIEYIDTRLEDLELAEDRLRLRRPGNGIRTFEVVYAALGCAAQIALARDLGARCGDNGALIVDEHQQTSVAGLYAAGDVVRGLNQVVVSCAEAAIAATDIHNRLRKVKTSRPEP